MHPFPSSSPVSQPSLEMTNAKVLIRTKTYINIYLSSRILIHVNNNYYRSSQQSAQIFTYRPHSGLILKGRTRALRTTERQGGEVTALGIALTPALENIFPLVKWSFLVLKWTPNH